MFTILYTAVITLFVLILIHHLYNYLKLSLTIPRVDDVIHSYEKKYDEIKQDLNKTSNSHGLPTHHPLE